MPKEKRIDGREDCQRERELRENKITLRKRGMRRTYLWKRRKEPSKRMNDG